MKQGHLFYDPVADDFCKDIDPKDVRFSNEVKALYQDYKDNRKGEIVTPFMVAARGGCSFVTKVRNMEEIGTAVGIVIDNQENEDPDSLIMSDDGSGAGIRIPSMMISKSDGDKLLGFLKSATKEEMA